jgi:integrase
VLGVGEGQSSAAKLAFEFLILTACRTNEVLGARWDEIDETERTWLVPSARMKGERRKRNKRSHVVLLSDRAIEILAAAKGLDGPQYIFPSPRSRCGPLSTNAFDGYIDSRGMTGKASAFIHRSNGGPEPKRPSIRMQSR